MIYILFVFSFNPMGGGSCRKSRKTQTNTQKWAAVAVIWGCFLLVGFY